MTGDEHESHLKKIQKANSIETSFCIVSLWISLSLSLPTKLMNIRKDYDKYLRAQQVEDYVKSSFNSLSPSSNCYRSKKKKFKNWLKQVFRFQLVDALIKLIDFLCTNNWTQQLALFTCDMGINLKK